MSKSGEELVMVERLKRRPCATEFNEFGGENP
jgi:hypothetical protein